jgi:Trk K+ transport system NAD-binding subunit
LVKEMITTLADLRTLLFPPTTRSTTIIVGLNGLTRLFVTDLEAAGHAVSVVEIENVPPEDSKAADEVFLADAGIKGARCVLAVTPNDERNLNFCRLAHRKFAVPMVIARLGLLGGVTSWARFNDSGMTKMRWSEMVPAILGDATPGTALARVTKATDREQIAEVELLTPLLLGLTIRQLKLDGCEVLAIRRNSTLFDDTDGTELYRGDVLTLVGNREAINKVRQSFTTL